MKSKINLKKTKFMTIRRILRATKMRANRNKIRKRIKIFTGTSREIKNIATFPIKTILRVMTKISLRKCSESSNRPMTSKKIAAYSLPIVKMLKLFL